MMLLSGTTMGGHGKRGKSHIRSHCLNNVLPCAPWLAARRFVSRIPRVIDSMSFIEWIGRRANRTAPEVVSLPVEPIDWWVSRWRLEHALDVALRPAGDAPVTPGHRP